MQDPRLQGLFTSLGATFEAEIARDEEEAAQDLAFSLRQGRSLADVLERGSWQLQTPSGPRPISVVAVDYVVAGDVPAVIAPLDRAVFEAAADRSGSDHQAKPTDPSPARDMDSTFLQLLRSVARAGARARIESASGSVSGRLLWAGTDHVAVGAGHRQFAISLQAIDSVVIEEGIGAGDR
jgi:hypothetical protein